MFIGPLLKKKTAIYEDNFRIAFPEKSETEIKQLVRASWGTAGRVLGEYPHLENIVHSQTGERIQIEIQGPNPNLCEQKRPSVMVAAHLSNWEMIALANAKLQIPTANLYSPPTNPLIDRMLRKSREAFMCELLPRDNSARPLMGALKKGKTIGMVIDRRIDEGQAIALFGRDKPTTTIAAKLALKFDIDLIPVRVERLQDANFKVTFCTPITPGNPGECESDQAIDMISQVHGLFEQWIRQQPQDWFCPKRLWPKHQGSSKS